MKKSEILKRYLKPMTLIIISILFWYYDYKMIGAAVFLIFLINNFYVLQMYWKKDNDKRKFIDAHPIGALGYTKLKVDLYKGIIATINVHLKER